MEAAKVEALFALAGKNDNGPEALSAMKKAWKAFEAGGYAIVVRGERMFSRLEVERDFVPRSEIGRSLMLRAQVEAEYVSRADVLRDYIPRTQIPSVYVSRNFHDNEVARIRAEAPGRKAPVHRESVWSPGDSPGPRAPAASRVESDNGPAGYDEVGGDRRPQAPLRGESEDRKAPRATPPRKAAPPSKRGAAPAARRSVAPGGGGGEWVKLRETQYKGWCRACRGNIEAGSEAYWMRDENGKSVMRCMDCGEG